MLLYHAESRTTAVLLLFSPSWLVTREKDSPLFLYRTGEVQGLYFLLSAAYCMNDLYHIAFDNCARCGKKKTH